MFGRCVSKVTVGYIYHPQARSARAADAWAKGALPAPDPRASAAQTAAKVQAEAAAEASRLQGRTAAAEGRRKKDGGGRKAAADARLQVAEAEAARLRGEEKRAAAKLADADAAVAAVKADPDKVLHERMVAQAGLDEGILSFSLPRSRLYG